MHLTPHVLELARASVVSGVNDGLVPFFGNLYCRVYGVCSVLLGHCTEITTVVVNCGLVISDVGSGSDLRRERTPHTSFNLPFGGQDGR